MDRFNSGAVWLSHRFCTARSTNVFIVELTTNSSFCENFLEIIHSDPTWPQLHEPEIARD